MTNITSEALSLGLFLITVLSVAASILVFRYLKKQTLFNKLLVSVMSLGASWFVLFKLVQFIF